MAELGGVNLVLAGRHDDKLQAQDRLFYKTQSVFLMLVRPSRRLL
jgi:hypothetical protein